MIVYRIMLCCNDERGDSAGRVNHVEIGDEISLAWPTDRGRVMKWSKVDQCGTSWVIGGIQIGRRRYTCRGRNSCVGNIFWDATSMTLEEARRLVRDLIVSGWVVEQHADDGPFADLVKAA